MMPIHEKRTSLCSLYVLNVQTPHYLNSLVVKLYQHVGQLAMTDNGIYHFVVNTGFNVNEAIIG